MNQTEASTVYHTFPYLIPLVGTSSLVVLIEVIVNASSANASSNVIYALYALVLTNLSG